MANSAALHELVSFLNQELRCADFIDSAFNGLQIESSRSTISKIGFAVDAGYSVIQAALQNGCELLVVHHGVLWGKPEPIVGPWARKLELCFSGGLSLYAAHLPLDGHPTLGNAAQIASELLGADEITSAFSYQGSPIGVTAKLKSQLSLDELKSSLTQCAGALASPLVLPFGKTVIKTVGIATGSGSFLIPEAARRGLDLFITGEPKQEAYHVAKEHAMSAIFMGHYASETFGVCALQRVLEKRFGVDSIWIDEPTGI
jgi:dinuclear metal center YbgI/SA1388 family protein